MDVIFDYLLSNISWNTVNKLPLISKNRKAQIEDWLVMGKSFKPIQALVSFPVKGRL